MTLPKGDSERRTAALFPKIHASTTQDELDKYRARIRWLVEKYVHTEQVAMRGILKDKDILEVGCGGRASGIYALGPYQPRTITAIDLSNQNVRTTVEAAKHFPFDGVRVEVGNALDLQFEEDSFDFVFSNGVIHHTQDPYRAFQQMVKVLKPNGHLLLGIYGYGGLWGKVAHPLIMGLGKVIPFSLAERTVNLTGLMKLQEASLLDFMYAPIQKTFRLPEILHWFHHSNFVDVVSLGSNKRQYQLGILTRLLFGDGYIHVMGRKGEGN